MDPYLSTIIKQAAAWGLAAGAVIAFIYGYVQYSNYRHALTLNMIPGQLP